MSQSERCYCTLSVIISLLSAILYESSGELGNSLPETSVGTPKAAAGQGTPPAGLNGAPHRYQQT